LFQGVDRLLNIEYLALGLLECVVVLSIDLLAFLHLLNQSQLLLINDLLSSLTLTRCFHLIFEAHHVAILLLSHALLFGLCIELGLNLIQLTLGLVARFGEGLHTLLVFL